MHSLDIYIVYVFVVTNTRCAPLDILTLMKLVV